MTAPDGRRLAAILSADVVGYSSLMSRNEQATIEVLKESRTCVGDHTKDHGGRIVDTAGDSILAEFPSVIRCVRCAVTIQKDLHQRNRERPPPRRMEFRIGVHMGDVVSEAGSIYGDGINVAARMQELSEPGGVCISATVLEQVRHHLSLRLESLGSRRVKNISEPVTAYRIQLDDEGPTVREGKTAESEAGVPSGIWERPAIAVLPFDNMTGDPDQDYFGDGLCEDLITLLSLYKFLPVIARNSSFTYRGRPVDVKQVSRDLGAQYVIEGSVRRANDRIRVSAQLIDASTAHHLWAGRYDRELGDLFAVQDEIAEQIAASIQRQLSFAEPERIVRLRRPSLDVWELAQRGWWHANQRTRADTTRAQELFRDAIALDHDFVWAHYGLVLSLAVGVFYQWTDEPLKAGLEMVRTAQACLRLDANDPHASLSHSVGCAIVGQLEQAIEAAERAVELSPSLAWGHYLLGLHLGMSGDTTRALEETRRAVWLSPRDPMMWVYYGGEASIHFAARDYEHAIDASRRALRLRPDWPNGHAMIAACCSHLERSEEARTHLAEMLRLQPEFTGAGVRATFAGAKPEIMDRYIHGLVKAGLPLERA